MTILLVDTTSEPSQTQVDIQLQTTLNVTGGTARTMVNQQIVTELGTGLLALEPELLVRKNQFIWRVTILLSLPTLGDLGQVGTIEIDATSGDILTDSRTQKEIQQHASRLYAGSTL
jgi:hypothetical protein